MKAILSALISIIFIIFIISTGCILDNTEKYLNDLESENIMVRKNAIYYLGKEKVKSAVPKLIPLLKSSEPKEVKISTIEALGEIMEYSAVDALLDTLTEKDVDVKITAIQALGKIQDPKAAKSLTDILNNKDSEHMRIITIWALGNIGDKIAIPTLTKLLGDPDDYIRYNAAQSLKRIGN